MKRKLLSILLTLCLAFSLLPTAALADGEGTQTNDVAQIGSTGYATLAEAIAAANDGQTVKMLNNTKVTQEIYFSGKTITLDLNGKIITGQFEDYYSVIEAQGTAATLIVEDTSAGKTGTIHSNHYGLTARDDGNITVNSGTIIGDDSAALSGNNTTGNMNFTVNGGTLTAGKGPAIYQSGQCNLTITGGTLNGGISLRMGQVNISGGTINATASSIDSPAEYYDYSGNAWLPDALYVFGGTYDKGDKTYGNSLNLNITGGTFNCTNGQGSAVAIYDLGKVTQTANINISGGKFATTTNGRNAYDVLSLKDIGVTNPKTGFGEHSGAVSSAISGGTFSSDVSAYVAEGYVQNENGTVEQLGETNAVAKIDDTYYKTLAEAVAAAKADEATTITLLKDVELPSYIYIKDKKNITLDLNGKNITRTGNGVFYVGNAKLRVTGTGTIFENQRDGFAPIIAKGSPNDVADYTTITIDENVTLKGDYAGIFVDTDTAGKNSYHNYGLVINMKGSIDLTAIDGGVSAYGVYVQGLNKITSGNVMQINLDGVTINTGDEAIYAAGYAKWNVKNCTFNAENAAIEVRAGDMTIDGGVYTAMASEFKCEANGNGSTTQGAALAIVQHTTKLPISVYVKNGVFHSAAAVAEKNIQKNDPKPNVDLQIADGQFNGVVVADDVLNFISGGYYTSDPSAYKAEGKFVVASDKAGYSYMISGTAPTKAEVIVNDKTAVTVPTNENLTNADKTAIQTKTNIDGVAEAVAGSKDAIVKKAGVDASKVDATELIEVEVAVDVAVSDVQKNEEAAVSSITFTAKPTATVKVNGSSAGETVDVTNAMLNGKPITVKLPLPAGFELKQIIHKSAGYADEYILQEGNAQGLKSFKIVEEDGVKIAVFTVSHFSDFELSGKVTYVAPSYSGGSSSYDPTYSVSTPSKTEHGTVTVSPKSASKGDTVTVTVKPDSGYVLETLTVTDKNGNELTLKDKGNGKYTFTMPAGKVEVKATFMEDNSMLNFFYDVPNNAYFYEAVKWAVKNGITTGVGNDLFAPEQPCTRAQIVTFLWRAAGSPEPKGAASGMSDVVSGSYYEKAVAWAIENGITTGTTTSTFSPDATCTRAQAVTFLARALKAKAASAAEFSDVPTGSYFADAVAWAAANGVTEGIGGGLFGSDNDCTRGQIVTFLYRAYNK